MSLQWHGERLSEAGTSLLEAHHPIGEQRLRAGTVSKSKRTFMCVGTTNRVVDETSLLYEYKVICTMSNKTCTRVSCYHTV